MNAGTISSKSVIASSVLNAKVGNQFLFSSSLTSPNKVDLQHFPLGVLLRSDYILTGEQLGLEPHLEQLLYLPNSFSRLLADGFSLEGGGLP